MTYQRPDGTRRERTLDPLGLVHKAGIWYLVASHEEATRVYRVDRIAAAHESGEPVQRPPGFDLAAFWEKSEAEYAASLPTFAARVRLGPLAQRHRFHLGPLSPRGVTEHETTDDGWVEQTLLFDTRRTAVAALLALAPEIEVVSPDELRDDLVAAAEQVITRCRVAHSASPTCSVRNGRPDVRPLLGTSVSVTVDRPLGSRHPRHGFRYPVNYGYVAGTLAVDGEPIDAYVLGIDVPVSEVEGIVVGLVVRADDVEDKLVVAPAGTVFTAAEIMAKVDFQERFFDHHVVLFDSSST